MQKRMLQVLDLTDTQKQQAKTILQSARQTAQPLAQQLKQDRAALTAAIEAGDSAKIQQLSTEMGSLRGNVLGVRSQAMSKVYALLTPDQKTKAEEFRQKAQQVLGKGNGE
ncbi:MAG: Spy/CpxP family protein refolding chaperone [Bryobacteraceae bacterium]